MSGSQRCWLKYHWNLSWRSSFLKKSSACHLSNIFCLEEKELWVSVSLSLSLQIPSSPSSEEISAFLPFCWKLSYFALIMRCCLHLLWCLLVLTRRLSVLPSFCLYSLSSLRCSPDSCFLFLCIIDGVPKPQNFSQIHKLEVHTNPGTGCSSRSQSSQIVSSNCTGRDDSGSHPGQISSFLSSSSRHWFNCVSRSSSEQPDFVFADTSFPFLFTK